jgi:hypothetical protein
MSMDMGFDVIWYRTFRRNLLLTFSSAVVAYCLFCLLLDLSALRRCSCLIAETSISAAVQNILLSCGLVSLCLSLLITLRPYKSMQFVSPKLLYMSTRQACHLPGDKRRCKVILVLN